MSPASVLDRLAEGQQAIQAMPGAFRRPAGALCWYLEHGAWPRDGVVVRDVVAAEKSRVDFEAAWPMIEALPLDAQMELLPDPKFREALRQFGPNIPEVRWMMLHTYHARVSAQ